MYVREREKVERGKRARTRDRKRVYDQRDDESQSTFPLTHMLASTSKAETPADGAHSPEVQRCSGWNLHCICDVHSGSAQQNTRVCKQNPGLCDLVLKLHRLFNDFSIFCFTSRLPSFHLPLTFGSVRSM